MVKLIFLTIFVIYCILATIPYVPKIKNSSYYYYLGLGFAFITNSLWLYLSKITTDFNTIHKYSFIWDGIILLTAAIIPIIFFNVKPEGLHLIGILLIMAGMILLKV